MAERLDIILFGVTGFTGMHCIPYLHKLTKNHNRNLTWGVAGRSEAKIKKVLQDYSKKLETDLNGIPIIIADVNDDSSLEAMAKRAKIVINTCGPYRFLGPNVVRACIKSGAHHVDVSGEPDYMERIELKENAAAKENGVYVVSACGFDSIPCDLGTIFLQSKFEGTLNSITTYLEGWSEETDKKMSGPSLNAGTWHSLVHGIANRAGLKSLRTELYPKKLPQYKPRLTMKKLPHKPGVVEGYAVPFMGSDKPVTRRTQRYLYENESKRPVQVETYFIVKSALTLAVGGFMLSIIALLSQFSFGRSLLLRYPALFTFGMFSNEQPSEEVIEHSWFSITFYGEGWKNKLPHPDDQYTTSPDKAIVGRVKGRNPGYGATCAALVLSAIMIITQTDKLPGKGKGGVYPPGAAFAKTTLIEELQENDVSFEILSEKNI